MSKNNSVLYKDVPLDVLKLFRKDQCLFLKLSSIHGNRKAVSIADKTYLGKKIKDLGLIDKYIVAYCTPDIFNRAKNNL